MKQFFINKKAKIFIYGAAAGGTILYGKMHDHGYDIKGFIDNRAEEIKELHSLPVYHVTHLREIACIEEIVVVIAVKNVFEHSRIARTLMKHGIQNVMYKPYAVLKGYANEEQKKLFAQHEQLVEYGYCEDGRLDKVAYIEQRQDLPKEYLLENKQDTQTVFVPLPLLFENVDMHEKIKERNACFLYPHIQFFNYLQGDVCSSPKYYLEYCEEAAKELNTFSITDAWRKNVIRNRAEVYHQMNHAFLFQKDFFVRNAPGVEWNEDGYFNLKSGKHRAAFYAARRLMYMPVQVKKKDMEIWLCADKAQEVNEVLQKNDIFELRAPIEHPYFYQLPCNSEKFFYDLCCVLALKIAGLYYSSPIENAIKNKKIHINLDDYGFISRFFRRCGAYVHEANENDEELKFVLEQIFHIPLNRKIGIEEKYDIAIIRVNEAEELENWKEKYQTNKCFVIAEDVIIQNVKNIEQIYCGVAWDTQLIVGFLEEKDV